MRTTFPFGSRPMPWDRNPQIIRLAYENDNVAPHGLTTRFNYTVPAGRKAILNGLTITLMRASAPTTAGLVVARLFIIPSGGGAIAVLRMPHLLSAVGEPFAVTVAPGALLAEGDSVAATTSDGSTGGTMSFSLSAILTEFDA